MNKSVIADKEYKDKLEDNFLAHIGFEYADMICDDLDRNKDQWQEIEIPDSLDTWFNDFHKLYMQRMNRRTFMKRLMTKAAIFILFFVAINYFLITNVEAYRKQFIKTVVNIQQSFTQIDFIPNDNQNSASSPEGWDDLYYLSYIPKGFKMIENKISGPVAYINYANDKGDKIAFQQYYMHVTMQIDTEEAEVSDVYVNNILAKLVKKDDSKIMYWIQDDRVIYVQTRNVSLSETIKIANSIKLNESENSK
jgi:hypothetical protein